MRKITRICAVVLLVVMLIEEMDITIWAQDGANDSKVDNEIVEQYVESINNGTYSDIAALFCEEQRDGLSKFFSDEENLQKGIGVYNVISIQEYALEKLDACIDIDYEFEEVKRYLLYMDCEVKESTQYFKEGGNYFQLITGKENNRRVILELSVATDVILENAIEIGTALITESQYESFRNERIEMFEEMEGFQMKTANDEESDSKARATFSPKTLSSYAFPIYIRVKNSSDGLVYQKNFKDYCYVVCATEFAYGTDGKKEVHEEAMKAFCLCVRNFGWYRSLYPYSATEGYDVTDNVITQSYDWTFEDLIDSKFPHCKSAMNTMWNVMMFDGAKKLFIPVYKAGSYNANVNSSQSTFYQNGSNYLATVKGYTYEEILHYYYDDAIGNEISSGPIIVCSSHVDAIRYTTTLLGHGKKCLSCGYIALTSHTWVNYNTYCKCSVCGYESEIILAN